MALWGISTTTETAANNYALPKHLLDTDKNTTPWNCFADRRGWIYRHYGDAENSGLSTNYYDEVLVPVAGLNTTGIASNTTGLGLATPVAVFFEDPNRSSVISVGGGGTDRISVAAGSSTGYVHLVYNELVYATAGAQISLAQQYLGTASVLVAYATSIARGASVYNFTNDAGITTFTNFNGQVTNRVAFAFTAPNTGAGTTVRINWGTAVVGTVTDAYQGGAAIKTLTADLIRNVGGAGTTGSVGIGTTTLTTKA
jgi:hypothetical protein